MTFLRRSSASLSEEPFPGNFAARLDDGPFTAIFIRNYRCRAHTLLRNICTRCDDATLDSDSESSVRIAAGRPLAVSYGASDQTLPCSPCAASADSTFLQSRGSCTAVHDANTVVSDHAPCCDCCGRSGLPGKTRSLLVTPLLSGIRRGGQFPRWQRLLAAVLSAAAATTLRELQTDA